MRSPNSPSALPRGADRPAGRNFKAAFGIRAQSFLARPRLLLNPLLLLAFTAAWIREVVYWLPMDAFGRGLNYWAFTDWLIDYSQGFIRRGLSGELFRLVPASVPPTAFVAVLSWTLILAVALGYLRLLVRARTTLHPLTLFGLLFLPSLVFFYLHDHNGIARKEILGYITLLLHLLIIEKSFPLGDGASFPDGNLRRYVGWLLPVAVILLPAVILVHEGNFLLFVPLHALITLSVLRWNPPRGFRRAAQWTGLLYLPAALAFGAVYLSGTPSTSTLFAICEKWNAVGAIREGTCRLIIPTQLSGSTLPASFEPMAWPLSQAVRLTFFFISTRWRDWILILPTLGILLWYLGRQTVYAVLRSRLPQSFSPKAATRYAGLFFCKYFLFPLLISLPIYLSAWDYGRWFTVACVNFVLVAISTNLPVREFALRKQGAEEGSPAADAREYADRPLIFYSVSILVCVLAVVLWLPHYCLFACEIIRSPLQFFDLSFYPH